ncbi:MAG: hypothetical protein CVU01_03120 [Bacteroidetes bacterium HGW-Bacteroidetes-18]|nr:MAG: hypothetical protein CVU01_03120 [Bacteroidetes bacterium HGW-Bacteroidetes-18]
MKKSKVLLLVAVAYFGMLQAQQSTSEKKQNTNKPKIFVVLDIMVHDTAMYEQYQISVEEIIKSFGGKYLVRSGGMAFDTDPDRKVIPIEGNWNPNRLIILQWDSMEQLQNFTTSEVYKKIAQLRANSATTKSLLVNEYLINHK